MMGSIVHSLLLPAEKRADAASARAKTAKLKIGTNTSRDHCYEHVPNPWGLSAGQAQILRLLAQGRCPNEIGKELNLSHKTVASHLMRVKTKMQARNTLSAAILWDRFERNSLDPSSLKPLADKLRAAINLLVPE